MAKSHPPGLYVLFITEMWERFSYYGMRALLVLFLAKALLYDKTFVTDLYGSYTGLVYLTPLLGGFMADKYWGNRKSIIVGGFMMAIGQFLMFMSGSLYAENLDLARLIMMFGLGVIILGNGFFKPNISTMVGQLYPVGDKRVDSAFTIFYMGINLGAFLSPLVCGGLGDTGNPADFKWGFLAACVGMIVSTLIFIWLKDHYIVTPDGKPVGGIPNKSDMNNNNNDSKVEYNYTKNQIIFWIVFEIFLFIFIYLLSQGIISKFMTTFNFSFQDINFNLNDVIGALIFSLSISAPGFIISDKSLTKVEKQRIGVIYIVAFFVIFFWAAFEQAGASLTFFADEQTNREIGLTIPKGILISIYLLFIALLSFLIIKAKKILNNEQKGVKPAILGLLTIATIYFIYAITQVSTQGAIIDVIPASFFQSVNAIAIVLFAPLFSIIWTFLGKKNLEPASPFKQAIGLFLLAIGYLVIAFGVKGIDPSTKVSMIWLLSLYTIHTFGELCLSPIGLSMVNKLAPLKFASVLMGVWFLSTAAANKFAGTLSSLYPETMLVVEQVKSQQESKGIVLTDKFDKAEIINGTNYISIDVVSLGAISDKQIKKDVVDNIFKGSITKDKSFVGFQINNLYSFFMLFVVMAGISSLILFILSSKLVKMMNGVV